MLHNIVFNVLSDSKDSCRFFKFYLAVTPCKIFVSIKWVAVSYPSE